MVVTGQLFRIVFLAIDSSSFALFLNVLVLSSEIKQLTRWRVLILLFAKCKTVTVMDTTKPNSNRLQTLTVYLDEMELLLLTTLWDYWTNGKAYKLLCNQHCHLNFLLTSIVLKWVCEYSKTLSVMLMGITLILLQQFVTVFALPLTLLWLHRKTSPFYLDGTSNANHYKLLISI